MGKNRLDILDELEEYVLKHGKVGQKEPYSFDSGMWGSDSVTRTSKSKEYSLKEGTFKIILTEVSVENWYGEYNVRWSKRTDRCIEIYEEDENKVNAKKCLGGEEGRSGMLSSSTSDIPKTPWEVEETPYIQCVEDCVTQIRKRRGD